MAQWATEGGAAAISVVIPVRDRPVELERAILSVLSQTVMPHEVIIVDDGSTPPVATPRAEAGDTVVRVLSNGESIGASASRNRGAATAEGDLIAFLDSDDYWLPGHLAELCKLREHAPDGTVVFTTRFATDPLQTTSYGLSLPQVAHASQVTRFDLLTHGTVTCSVIGVSREAVAAGLRFREDLPALQDYDFLIRACGFGRIRCSPAATAVKTVSRERVWTADRSVSARKKLLSERSERISVVARVVQRWQIRYEEAIADNDASRRSVMRRGLLRLRSKVARSGLSALQSAADEIRQRAVYRSRHG